MSVKERILTIRLIEKLSANPAYAKALGIAVKHTPRRSRAADRF